MKFNVNRNLTEIEYFGSSGKNIYTIFFFPVLPWINPKKKKKSTKKTKIAANKLYYFIGLSNQIRKLDYIFNIKKKKK